VIREKRTVEDYLTLMARSSEDRTWYYRNFHYEEPGRAPYMIGHAENISGILRGILPICASCKRIRNQRSDWEQVEAYIREHTEAEFGHGICPEYRNRLYPGFDSSNRSVKEFSYTERKRVAGFVPIDCRLVLKREPDFVQSFQQALTYEWVNREAQAQTVRVANLTLFQIDRELIGFVCLRAPQ